METLACSITRNLAFINIWSILPDLAFLFPSPLPKTQNEVQEVVLHQAMIAYRGTRCELPSAIDVCTRGQGKVRASEQVIVRSSAHDCANGTLLPAKYHYSRQALF